MEYIFLFSLVFFVSCRTDDGVKHPRSSEPVCGRTSDLAIMYNFIEAKFTMKQDIEELKEEIGHLQAKLQKLENVIKGVPGPNVNIANRYKAVTQSSEFSHTPYPAHFAVDGDPNTFSHTGGEANPWWSMEFCSDVIIAKVRLRSRLDCCDSQMTNMVVTVDNVLCGGFDDAIGVGNSIDITCDRPLTGKLLQIQRLSSKDTVLSMSEVQVFSSNTVC